MREFVTAFTIRLALQTGLLLLIGGAMVAYGYGLFARVSAQLAAPASIQPVEPS
jgi:hypothetical protein